MGHNVREYLFESDGDRDRPLKAQAARSLKDDEESRKPARGGVLI